MNKQLAIIRSAALEMQDHGILSFRICVDYEDGGSHHVGGLALDTFDKTKDKRVGTAYGCEMIRRILLELRANDFSDLSGKHIWVLGEGEGFRFKVDGIKSLNGDNKNSKAVIFDDILKEFT